MGRGAGGVVDALVETVDERWGEGVTMAAVNPTVAVDEQAVERGVVFSGSRQAPP